MDSPDTFFSICEAQKRYASAVRQGDCLQAEHEALRIASWLDLHRRSFGRVLRDTLDPSRVTHRVMKAGQATDDLLSRRHGWRSSGPCSVGELKRKDGRRKDRPFISNEAKAIRPIPRANLQAKAVTEKFGDRALIRACQDYPTRALELRPSAPNPRPDPVSCVGQGLGAVAQELRQAKRAYSASEYARIESDTFRTLGHTARRNLARLLRT